MASSAQPTAKVTHDTTRWPGSISSDASGNREPESVHPRFLRIYDEMNFAPRFSITNTVAAALTEIERTRGFLEAASLSDEWITSMRSRAFLLEAHHTTHIEGTRLTVDEATDILAGRDVPGADPDDARELLNYREALDYVGEYLNDGGPVTERLILEIHRRLVDGVRGGSAAPGEYRRVQNFVINSATGETIYTPPPAQEVPSQMRGLIDWLNQPTNIHPVIVSGIAQFQLVHIHPFLDGNGRTSRLLSTLLLYRAGYDFKRLFTISEYYDRNRMGFYGALQGVRQSNMDMTGWVEYFTAGLASQLAEVKQRGELAIRQDVLSRRHKLTVRQSRALGYILERGRTTIAELESLFPEITRRTLQRDLRTLIQKDLVLRHGRTSNLEYVPVDNLR